MEHMRRLAGMGKAKVPLPPVIQAEDKDESVVFFRELYKREKYRDVNLLEPMYSVEFDALQGGHVCRVPSGKRDFLIPVDEKHDYDWLMTPPAAPLFPSLDTESNSARLALQKELPLPPRPAKPSASRLPGKPDGATASARPASHTASSSSKTTYVKGAPAVSKERKQPRTADQRPSHKVPTNGKQKAAAAAVPGTRTAPKKHSERCYASQATGTNASTVVKGVADQQVPEFKTPKNLITTARSIFQRQAPLPAVSAQSKGAPPLAVSGQSKGAPPAVSAQSKGPGSGVDVKKKNGKAARQPCPPAAATRGMAMTELQLQDRRNELPPPRGMSGTGSGTGGERASSTGGRAGRAALMRGTPKADGRAWV